MLDLDIEWLEASSVNSAELRETWARLCIKVGDSVPCSVLDDASGSVRNSLYLPLYPLAEWFAYNWWRLFYESYSSARETRHNYHLRHSLVTAAEGFALPDLAFYPLGDFVHLLWRPRAMRHAPLRFLNEGQASLKRRELMATIESFVQRVIARLEARNIYDTALQGEWAAIQALDAEEMRFCEAAVRLGVDPFYLPEGLESQLADLHKALPGPAFEELLAAVPPHGLADAAQVIDRFQGKTTLDLSALHSSGSRIAKADWRQPWEIGYHFARKLRKTLKLGSQPLPDDSSLTAALGGNGRSLYSELPSSAKPALSGIARFSGTNGATFGVASGPASNRRFSFCRALFPSLMKNFRENGIHVATSGYTPVQQAGRAFAAEFLAPRQVVSERLGELSDQNDRVDEVAKLFGVSSLVIEHQNQNNRAMRNAPTFAF